MEKPVVKHHVSDDSTLIAKAELLANI